MSGEPIVHVWTTDVTELKVGVTVARAILPERLEDIPVQVLNSSDAPCCVKGETILSELSLAKCVDDIEEVEENVASGESSVAKSYEHMSKLLDGIDESVTREQRVNLEVTLREYSDVFSTGELDLGD